MEIPLKHLLVLMLCFLFTSINCLGQAPASLDGEQQLSKEMD